MTELYIGTLSARSLDPGGPENDVDTSARAAAELRGRIPHMLEHLSGHRLEEAFSAIGVPDGEWCLRRLDVMLSLDPERPGPALETQWAQLVVNELLQRLHQPLGSGPADVLHFPRRTDALNDLVQSLAAGRADHAWAWHQLGLLGTDDPDPAGAPASALMAALRRWPEQALPAVAAYGATFGAAPLHRLLGEVGWQELAALAARAADAPGVGTSSSAAGAAAGSDQAGPGPIVRTDETGGYVAATSSSGRDPRAAASAGSAVGIIRQSRLAAAFRHSGIRPNGTTAAAWAVVVLAEADPGSLRGPGAQQVLQALAATFMPAPATADSPDRSSPPAAGRNNRQAPEHGAVAAPASAEQGITGPDTVRLLPKEAAAPAMDASPPYVAATPSQLTRRHLAPAARQPSSPESSRALPEAAALGRDDSPDGPGPQGFATLWAGLPFLLATAVDTGMPDVLFTDSALSGRPLRWVLHRIGQLLVPAAPDDPAVLAFTGLIPGAKPPQGDQPNAGELAALGVQSGNWARTTAVRLGRPHHDPYEVVADVAFRRGTVLAQPGWIEVHLDLADVDMDIRRAGLDLDPGWVPWLGVVVRYVYE